MTIKVALTDVFPESIHPIVAEYVPEGWSYELALELLAARFPKPDLRDSIRRLPVRPADFTPNIGCAPSAARDVDRVRVPVPTLVNEPPVPPLEPPSEITPLTVVERLVLPTVRFLEPRK